jgi:hypothetical protein
MKLFGLKKFSFIALFLLGAFSSYSQNGNPGIFFQAIARDEYANPAKNRVIYVQSRIIQTSPSGTILLTEQFKTNTDDAGVFSISVGNGSRLGGSTLGMNYIEWSKGPFFLGLKIAIEPVAPISNWDYSKELIDLGISPFGAVPYALYAENPNKLNIADSVIKYVTPFQLNASKFDSTFITAKVNNKVNIADSTILYVTPTQLKAITFDSNNIYNQLALKANITDLNAALGNSAGFTSINTSINSLTNSVSYLNGIITANANTNSITSLVSGKEDISNKSVSIISDASSDSKYPSVKSVKDYVDSQIVTGISTISIQDATTTIKGKIKLAGDLSGTADAPTIANGAITNAKIASGIDAAKITGNFSGTAANATNAVNATYATNANYATSAGTASSSITANTASTAISATYATNANYATSAGTASSSITANTASTAISATYATNANYATSAGTASSSITANTASTAISATYATNAGTASSSITANSALTANSATTATTAGNITATSNTTLTSLTNLNTVGTITAGTWSASTIDISKGGTGATTKVAAFNALSPLTTTGDLLYASATNTANRLPIGSNGQVLSISSGIPSWSNSINTTLNLGTIGSSSSANGATLTVSGSNSTLNLTPADATNPGLLTSGSQYIGGAKTFMTDITINGVKVGASNYVPGGNTVLGLSALNSITTGTYNIGIGPSAAYALTTGVYDVAVGGGALAANTSGFGNTAIGNNALNAVVTTNSNTAVGASSAQLSVGGSNTSIGASSFYRLVNGNNNVAVGSSAAYGTITSTQGVFIGSGASPANNSSTNEIAIGYNATGLGDNTTVIGNSSTNSTRIYGDLLLSQYNGAITDAGNYPLQVVGNTLTSGSSSANTFISTVATGTSPFTVSSTTPVPNLNIGGTATALSTATNYVQSSAPNPINVSTANTFPSQVVSSIINTNGRPVQVTVFGDIKVQYANEYCSIRLYRDNTAIGSELVIKNLTTDGASAPFSLNYIDNPTTGSYTYYLKITGAGGPAGTLSFGATTAPTITLLELR